MNSVKELTEYAPPYNKMRLLVAILICSHLLEGDRLLLGRPLSLLLFRLSRDRSLPLPLSRSLGPGRPRYPLTGLLLLRRPLGLRERDRLLPLPRL